MTSRNPFQPQPFRDFMERELGEVMELCSCAALQRNFGGASEGLRRSRVRHQEPLQLGRSESRAPHPSELPLQVLGRREGTAGTRGWRGRSSARQRGAGSFPSLCNML